MASWDINKGIGRTVEFKGLKAQYLFLFAGGLLAVFVLVVVCYLCGMSQWLCLDIGLVGATLVMWQTFAMNRKYGQYGLMKQGAIRMHPRYLIKSPLLFIEPISYVRASSKTKLLRGIPLSFSRVDLRHFGVLHQFFLL